MLKNTNEKATSKVGNNNQIEEEVKEVQGTYQCKPTVNLLLGEKVVTF